jgi:heme A synthase
VPAVPLGNLLGGYLMLALLSAHAGIVTGGGSGADATASSRLPWLALALIGAMFVQAYVGALIGAQFALRSCPDLGRCGDHVPTLAGALNPLEPLRVVEGHFVAPPGAAHLHTIHRALGAVVSIAALALAWAMRPGHRYVAALVAVLALLTPLLGAAALLWMPSLPLTVLHNAAAAAMIAVLAAIAAIRRTK